MPLRNPFIAIAAFLSSIVISNAALPSPTDVLNQNGAAFPQTWGTNDGKPDAAYYEMAKSIAHDPATRDELLKGLRALPSLSVTMAVDDLFGSEKGIYANPRQSGSEWERAALIEYFPTDGSQGFHVQCGIRIQGGWNRRPEESPKHDVKVFARSDLLQTA